MAATSVAVEAGTQPETALNRGAIATLSAGHMFTDLNQGAVPALLPFFIGAHDLSYAAASGLVLAATITSSVIQPLFGRFADGRPSPWLIPVGVFLAGGGLALSGLAPSYGLIFLAFALSGAGVAAFHPEAARFANYVAGSQRATGISLFGVGGSIGFAIAPVTVTPLMLAAGLPGTVLLVVPAATIALFLTWRLPWLVGLARASHLSKKARADAAGQADAWGPFARLTATIVFRSIVFYVLNAFIPLYWINVLGQPPAVAGAALTVLLVTGICGTLLGGRLADRYGRRIVVLCGVALLTPLMLALVAQSSALAATALLVPIALALYAPNSVMVVMGQEYLPNRIGTASGVTLGLAISIGGLVAPLFGALADHYSLPAALTVLALLPLVSTALALTLPERPRASFAPG